MVEFLTRRLSYYKCPLDGVVVNDLLSFVQAIYAGKSISVTVNLIIIFMMIIIITIFCSHILHLLMIQTKTAKLDQ